MLPAGLVKATSAASTPLYYMAWSDAFIAVDFESITLPLLFSSDEVYKGYYSTMRRLHSRKASEWERMNVHYTRARKCYRNGQFVECVMALQHACLLRRDVFVADDYQVGAAYEHAAWAATHLALIRIGETDHINERKKDPSYNASANEAKDDNLSGGEDDDSESALSEEDSDGNKRPRRNLDTHNPNEVHRLFAMAEQLLKTCAAKKRLLPKASGGGSKALPSAGLSLTVTMGGGVLKPSDLSGKNTNNANAPMAASITTFPNRTLLEFTLYHNCSNYWVRRRKWRAALKYTALAEARYKALLHKGLVRPDDVVPSLVNGPSAMECFLRCRSELIRLRSQFVAGNALGGGESLLFQKPAANLPTAAIPKANQQHSAMMGTIGGESYLSGHSLGLGSATTAVGGNAGQVALPIATCLPLTHDPLINPKLLPNTVSGDAAAIANCIEERHLANATSHEGSNLRGYSEEHLAQAVEEGSGLNAAEVVNAETVLAEGIASWLRTDKQSAIAGAEAAPSGYLYLNPYPLAGIPLSAILPTLQHDPSFRRASHERSLYEANLAQEIARQAEEQEAFDKGTEGVAAPNKTANNAIVQRLRDAMLTCERAMDARAALIAHKALANEGFLKYQVWCSPSSAPPPAPIGHLEADRTPLATAAPTPMAGAGPSSTQKKFSPSVDEAGGQSSGGKYNGDGVWCDVAVSFVVAKRELSVPAHWSAKDHTIPFLYHYTAAILDFNARKFALAQGHLDRCARIVLATATEAAPLGKLHAAAEGQKPYKEKAGADEHPVADPTTYLEVNPFWWEKGVVTLRHHCLDGPSQDYYSKYNSTKKAVHNPVEQLRRQIMTEHVTAEQARKKRLLHEQVLRNRMLKEEGGDEEIVDAVCQTTGKPSWAIEPSMAEVTSIVNDLAGYSDNLRQWRDRRGLPASTQHYQPHPELPTSEGPSQLNSPKVGSETIDIASTQPPSTAPVNPPSDQPHVAPSSGPLQKLTFAQKQAQKGGQGPTQRAQQHNTNTNVSAVSTAPIAPTLLGMGPRSRTPSQQQSLLNKRNPLPLLRDLAGDVLVASRLRRQLHQKHRSGSAGSSMAHQATAPSRIVSPIHEAPNSSVNTRPPIPPSGPSGDDNDAIVPSGQEMETSTNPNKASAMPASNVFLTVHNALVDALVARQEAQLKEETAAYASHNPATDNVASCDMPAPSASTFGEEDINEASHNTSVPSPLARRPSLFDVEGSFGERRRSMLKHNAPNITRPPGPTTSNTTQLHSQTLLSLYRNNGADTREGGAGTTSAAAVDRTPLKIAVTVATEEEMLAATSFGVSAVRSATTPFGRIKTSALMPSPLLSGGGGSTSPSPRTHASNNFSGSSPLTNTIPGGGRSPMLTPKPHLGSPPSISDGKVNASTNSIARMNIPLSASPVGQANNSTSNNNTHINTSTAASFEATGQFRLDFEKGAVTGVKKFNLVPHLDGITEKQQALRAMLPSVDFKSQRDLYRTIVAELAENEEILRLRRVELQQRLLRHEADKIKQLASMQSGATVA